MKGFHTIILISLLAFFGLLTSVLMLWDEFGLKYYELYLGSEDVKTRVWAIDGLIGMGESGKERLRNVFVEGREPAEMLIECWTEVNERNHWGEAQLHYTASWGFIETAKLLVAKGADVNVACDRGLTPLHLAAGNGHAEMAQFLIAMKANVNATDNDEQTPLHKAAWTSETGTVAFLLEAGADINATDHLGLTPYQYAHRNCRKSTAEFLYSHGATRSKLGSGW